jgi:hypothetical protein
MTKNKTRKGLAFGAGLALVASGLGVAPATAAAGDLVTLSPTTGINTGVFINDSFSMTSFPSSQLNTTASAVRIDNPDQDLLLITVVLDGAQDGSFNVFPTDIDVRGITAQGAMIDLALSRSLNVGSTGDGQFAVDMKTAGVESLIISGVQGTTASDNLKIDVQPVASISDGGTREIQNLTYTLTNSTTYTLDLPTEDAVTFTSDANATAVEVAAGLDALISAQKDTAAISNNAGALRITYANAGDIATVATLVVGNVVVAIEETTPGNTGTTTDEVQKTTADLLIGVGSYTLDLPGEAAVTFTTDATPTIAEIVIGFEALINAQGDTATVSADTNKLAFTYPDADGNVALATLVRNVARVATEGTAGDQTTNVNAVVNFNSIGDSLENGVFDFDSAANRDSFVELAYGAGEASATITTWIESESPANLKTVDSNYASLSQTVTWYDTKGVVVIPRVERFNSNLNDVGNNLHATIQFNKPINLEQFDINQWTYQVTTTGLPSFTGDFVLVEEEDIAGLGAAAKNADSFGRYAFDTAQTVAANTTYTVNVHSKLAETATDVERWFSSTGYSISNGYAAAEIEVEPLIVDTADVDYDGTAGTNNAFATAKIRAGVKSVTYGSQLAEGDGTDLKAVSVPMLAVVTNGAFMPTGSSISIAGSASAMTLANEVRMVTGFTDANGKFNVTVVSSAANKSESYNVQFYVLNNGNFETDGLDGSKVSLIQASYGAANASATSLEAVNSVVAGAEVTVSLTVKDQFGSAIFETAAGKKLNVSLEAPDKDDLDVNVAVSADGEVSFTFANYLTTGSSDLLTATLYTGSSTDKTVIDTVTVTLYNTGATGAVQVPKTLLGSVTYDDFIADGAKVVTGVTVDPDQDIQLTGTIVDANGVGIPAAVVIISAPGMQIQEQGSTKYYMDTHTINANSAGVFDVNLNAHMVNTTGVDVTVTTADGKTATTVVKTYLPEDTGLAGATLNGDNLVFTMDTPANVVMNKTYAVTAKLTDKWGNPVKTSATAVKLQGAGSFELNGVSTEISKDFDANGEALVYLRSVKDIAGPGTLQATLEAATYTALDVSTGLTAATALRVAETTTNVVTTVWDETVFTNTFSKIVQVLASEADIVTAQKVNAGSFKGYVALYALGYEGQRMSAKVGNDWVIVPAIPAATNDLFRAVEFVGAGVEISVRLYIDRVLVATIPLLTK